jgi:hypothetical protein
MREPRKEQALRVHLHARELRGVVAGVLGPLAGELRADHGAEAVRITRGWLGGPHLELTARPTGASLPWAAMAERVSAAVAPWSGEQLTEEAYTALARELGRLEGVDASGVALVPAGTVRVLEAGGRPPWTGALGGLRTGGLATLCDPLVRSAAAPTTSRLLTEVAEAFIVLAAAHPFGAGAGTFSFRSHAEAFFHWTAPTDGYDVHYRAAFEQRRAKDAPVLRAVVRRVLDGPPDGSAGAWSAAFATCMARFTAATAVGELSADLLDAAAASAQPDEVGPPGQSDRRASAPSEFHARVEDSGVTAQSAPWFPAYRLTLNLFYELLPVLDVTPLQRFYLCHACAEVVDEVLGETWQERLTRVEALTASGSAAPALGGAR